MKPDQHKQKHATRYKKKHGIVDSKPKPKDEDIKTNSANSQQPKYHRRNENFQQSMSDDKGQNDRRDEKRAYFGRRTLASNWEQYEEQEEQAAAADGSSEEQQQRGLDFSQCAQVHVDAMAHFRFADEAEWESGTESAAAVEGGLTDVLSIDVPSLAASLRCVPLHTRLGLPSDALHLDMVETLNSVAANHMKNYRATLQQDKKEAEVTNQTSPTTEGTGRASIDTVEQRLSGRVGENVNTDSIDVFSKETGYSGPDDAGVGGDISSSSKWKAGPAATHAAVNDAHAEAGTSFTAHQEKRDAPTSQHPQPLKHHQDQHHQDQEHPQPLAHQEDQEHPQPLKHHQDQQHQDQEHPQPLEHHQNQEQHHVDEAEAGDVAPPGESSGSDLDDLDLLLSLDTPARHKKL